MSSNACDAQIPPTEIQISEAIRVSDPETADTIRRLAFQRDALLARPYLTRSRVFAAAKELYGIDDDGCGLTDRLCRLLGVTEGE